MQIDTATDWTVGDLIENQRQQILRVNHEYQRGLRWNDMQKRMFIDSILRGYSIPAFYFHRKETSTNFASNTYFDIVDGQQRIDALYSFCEDAFELLDPSNDVGFRFPNFVKDEPCAWGGKRFGDLSEELQEKLTGQPVVVFLITTDNENSIRDLFIRLQGGTPLTPQDKRDSWPGNFTEFVLRVGGKSGVDKWYGLPVFKEVAKVTNESRRRQLVAQVFMLFWTTRNESKFCEIKSAHIDEFYHAHVGFDVNSEDARRFQKVCNVVYQALAGKPKVAGHYIIHAFLLCDSLLKEYASGWEALFANALFEFEQHRRQAAEDRRNRVESEYGQYYTEYGHLTQTRSDAADSIRRRHAFFVEEMLKLLSPTKLDAKRSFSELERKTVFFRDLEACQWCRMNGKTHKVSWDESETHHVTPHAEGGPTDLVNAALVHRDCHPKGQQDVDDFSEWWYETRRNAEPAPGHREAVRSYLPPNGTKTRFRYGDAEFVGQVIDGELHLRGGAVCRTFSAASREVTGTSRNGWRDWQLKLAGKDAWILADDWRRGIEPFTDDEL